MQWNYVLGGDLNPTSGFCFPLFSMVFSWGISIRVETCGRQKRVANERRRISIAPFRVLWPSRRIFHDCDLETLLKQFAQVMLSADNEAGPI
jgi:hypothetical protein